MITFKQFLAEAIVTRWDQVSIPEKQAIDLLNAHCKSGLRSIANGSVLWRGDRKLGAFSAVDSSTGVRTSKDTNNLYQLMMDNAEDLKDVPSRSNSMICSSNRGTAASYGAGDLYAVFPADGTKIAVSKEEDFIHTKIDFPRFGLRGMSIRNGFRTLLLDPFTISATAKQTDIAALDAVPAKLSLEQIERIGAQLEHFLDAGSQITEYFKRNKNHLFSSIANDFFTRGNLGVHTITAGESINADDVECWFSGKAVMIRSDIFKMIIAKMKGLGLPVHKKYK